MKNICVIILSTIMLFSIFPWCAEEEIPEVSLTDWEFTLSRLSSTDALGREITPYSGYKSEKKYVGVYFFPWFGGHDTTVYNIKELLEKYENGVAGNPENPLWAVNGRYYNAAVSPNGAFHYWDEPLFGYYQSSDPWVIARQLELLAYAEVDFIMMDFTNSYIYEKTTLQILDIIAEMTAAGCPVPKMAFMLPNDTKADDTLTRVYDTYISKAKYADCFFIADGAMNPSLKPLVTANFNMVNKGNAALPHIWAKTMFWAGSPKNAEYFPAGDIGISQTNFGGMMGVNVGINTSWFSEGYMAPDTSTIYGRGWTAENLWAVGDDKENVLNGTLFDYQWNNVFNAKEPVNLVFISCWNEWWAQKQGGLKDYAVFVDTFSEAFSKDLEPTSGDLKDNYYMQLVSLVRKFKHEGNASVKGSKVESGFSWSDVKNSYLDITGDAKERNYPSIDPKVIYTDNSNRNDIVSVKVANDGEYLYFKIDTAEPAVFEKENFMNVYLSVEGDGYDYMVCDYADGTAELKKNVDGSFVSYKKADYSVSGYSVYVTMPLIDNVSEYSFKITDGIPFCDVMDFYLYGDSAPYGRLNYVYDVAN